MYGGKARCAQSVRVRVSWLNREWQVTPEQPQRHFALTDTHTHTRGKHIFRQAQCLVANRVWQVRPEKPPVHDLHKRSRTYTHTCTHTHTHAHTYN